MPTTACRSVLGTIALAVLVAAGTGCSSGSGPAGGDSEVLEGLGALAGDSSAKAFAYVDVAKARELSKTDKNWLGSVGLPGGPLTQYSLPPWGGALKANQVSASVDTESGGHWEGSFDEAAITAELKANGYRRTGDDGTWTKSGRVGMSLRVSEREISYTTEGDTSMAAVHPKDGASLADKEEYRYVAECLGDVYRADFAALAPGRPVHLSALGQRAAAPGENTEILCLLAEDEATARRAAAKLRSVVAEEAPAYAGAKVTVEKGDRPMVRAVVPDTGGQKPGRLIRIDIELWTAVAGSEL